MSKKRWSTISTHSTRSDAIVEIRRRRSQAVQQAIRLHEERCKRRTLHAELAGLPEPKLPEAIPPTAYRLTKMGNNFCIRTETT